MEPPATVRSALADRPVEGAVCLEAGAGVGNGTAGLLAAGAKQVIAITNDREHATGVRERLQGSPESRNRVAVIEGDLRTIPLPTDSVDVVLAHALFNVIPPKWLPGIVAELTRVVRDGGHLVVDDYAPIPADSPVRRLFAIENAAAEIATGRSALYFYPEAAIAQLFAGYGWSQDRSKPLLDPVPWTAELLEAHLDEIRGYSDRLPENIATALATEGERLVAETGSEDVGTMYSLAVRRPASPGSIEDRL